MTDGCPVSSDHLIEVVGSTSTNRARPLKPDRRRLLATAGAAAATLIGRRPTRADPSQRRRVAIIGHTGRGNYGHNLHTMWLSVPETEIVGLADPDDEGRERARRQLHLDESLAWRDYHRMLKEVRPEIVVVSPRQIDQHRDMAVAAAEAGARGIYCEKPFCRTPREAEQIVQAIREAGTRLALAHRNRYHPVIPVVQAAITEGAIGQVLEIRSRGLEDHRGGVQDLWVLGTHLFDLARVFFGDAVACSAELLIDGRPVKPSDVTEGAEGIGPIGGDQLHARFDMSSGIPLYFDSIRNAGVKAAAFGLQFIGNDGIIDLRIDREPLAHLVPGNPFRPTPQARKWVPISSAGIGKTEPIPKLAEQVSGHVLAARDLLDAVTNDRQPLSSAEDGMAVVEMIHAVFASHANGSRRVKLPTGSSSHALRSSFGG